MISSKHVSGKLPVCKLYSDVDVAAIVIANYGYVHDVAAIAIANYRLHQYTSFMAMRMVIVAKKNFRGTYFRCDKNNCSHKTRTIEAPYVFCSYISIVLIWNGEQ